MSSTLAARLALATHRLPRPYGPPAPRFGDATSARCLLFDANTPWKRVKLTLGLGTRLTSLAIKYSGSKTTWAVPSRYGVFNR